MYQGLVSEEDTVFEIAVFWPADPTGIEAGEAEVSGQIAIAWRRRPVWGCQLACVRC